MSNTTRTGERCNYCGKPPQLLRAQNDGYPYAQDYGPVWCCIPCRAWVGCHPNTVIPLGRVANKELRQAKMAAHAVFDPMWKQHQRVAYCSKQEARKVAYDWLAEQMGLPVKKTHIGMFDVEDCQRVVQLCLPWQAWANTLAKEPA